MPLSVAERSKRWRQSHPEKARNATKNWRRANPDKYRASRRKTYSKSPELRLLYHAKSRAKTLGVTFSLSVKDIVIPTLCPLLGYQLIRDCSAGINHPHNVSLDRINPSEGYCPDNVWVISRRANAIKNNASPDELRRIAAIVEDQLLRSSQHEYKTEAL